jgi:serine/threonine protein kinase
MNDFSHICPNCCKESGDGGGYCPVCGIDAASIKNEEFCIPAGSVLLDRYYVGKVIGQGGFGITYLGYDAKFKTKIALKEYFPHGYAFREIHKDKHTVYSLSGDKTEFYNRGIEKFIAEARRLAQFSGAPGIVNVRDYFSENNTAYIVMEFVEGKPLADILEKRGRLSEAEVTAIFLPIIKTLQKVHAAEILHRDIAPDNIMVEPDGTARLIDFGASAEVDESAVTSAAVIKHFYVPEEQYDSNRRRQGAWTDVYALSATIFRALEGSNLPDALERLRGMPFDGFTVPVSAPVKAAVIHGLALFQKDRAQNVEELLEAFSGVSEGTSVYNKPKKDKTPKTAVHTPEDKKRPTKLIAAVLSGVALLAVCAVIFIPRLFGSVPVGGEVPQSEITTAPPAVPSDWEYTVNVIGNSTLTKYNGDYGDDNYVRITIPTEIDGNIINYLNNDIFSSNTENKDIYLTVPDTCTYVNKFGQSIDYYVIVEKSSDLFTTNGALRWVKNGPVFDLNCEEGIYTGDLGNGKPNGNGTITYANGEVKEGFWINGVYQGEAAVTFPNAGLGVYQYEEEPEQSENPEQTETTPTAQNETYVENRDYTLAGIGSGKYTGGMKDGKPEGKGVLTMSGGGYYDGNWVDGRPEGQGKMVFVNVATYTGGWKAGQYDGQGTLELADGSKYVGGWKNGQKNGKGAQYTPRDKNDTNAKPGSFQVEEGTFENGDFVGDYTRTTENRNETRIEYNNREDENNGTYTRRVVNKNNDGSVDEWDDVFVNGNHQGEINRTHTAVEKDVTNYDWNGGKYTGHMSDNNPDGQGTFIDSDGNKYVGGWQNGNRHGKGTEYIYTDRNNPDFNPEERTGNWQDGHFVGDFTIKTNLDDGGYELRYRKAADDGHWLGSWGEDGEVIVHYEQYNSSGKKTYECDQVWRNNEHIESRNERNY